MRVHEKCSCGAETTIDDSLAILVEEAARNFRENHNHKTTTIVLGSPGRTVGDQPTSGVGEE